MLYILKYLNTIKRIAQKAILFLLKIASVRILTKRIGLKLLLVRGHTKQRLSAYKHEKDIKPFI
ncbi:hypothetical protein DHW03_02060 [Pedobacter yonginense]|uniref:Uncharacterized protein n=1 Tax=Pedobacter yonginense TaxID=651869 RepID=A0A317EPS3_9SPHI|nr:hypothetical protein DHW03_02060 [Pedobacter yonginense]